jgi:putative membrane protein
VKSIPLTGLEREPKAAPFLVSQARPEAAEAHDRELGKGVLAGLIGGVIGTIVMTEFQNAWSKASEALKSRREEEPGERKQQESEDATMKAAAKLGEAVGRPLSHEQRKKLGPVVHYMFGTLQGGVYGAVTELSGVRGGFIAGLSLGAALFALADEVAVPALGLSGKPSDYPLSSHLYGLAAHLVYGVSTEVARRGLRASL